MPDQSAPRFPPVRQIEALNAQTGPVLVAYPTVPELDELLARVAQGTPDSDALADDGVRHAIWPVRDAATIARITALFDAMPALYISDGHHRSAAAARVAAGRRQANPRTPARKATTRCSSSRFLITRCAFSTTTASCAIFTA